MSDRILAIDPGPVQSAWLTLWDGIPQQGYFGIIENDGLRSEIGASGRWNEPPVVVIEKVQSYGMAVGAEVFETVFWSGRFAEAASPLPVYRIGRKAIVTHLCGSARAKDPNVRAALIDRFGGPAAIRKGGALYGVSKDVWSALAIACAWQDGVR